MDELAREYVETHNRKIVDQLYELGLELEKMEKLKSSEGGLIHARRRLLQPCRASIIGMK